MHLKLFALIFLVTLINLSSSDSAPNITSVNSKYENIKLKLISPSGDVTYFAQETKILNWFESWEFCRYYGMHLAEVHSVCENEAITSNLLHLKSYWIGGTDLGEYGKFTWFNSARQVSYKNFHDGEPNRHDEFCLMYGNNNWGTNEFKWNNYNCELKIFSICEDRPRISP